MSAFRHRRTSFELLVFTLHPPYSLLATGPFGPEAVPRHRETAAHGCGADSVKDIDSPYASVARILDDFNLMIANCEKYWSEVANQNRSDSQSYAF
jgi:hypothetical protein